MIPAIGCLLLPFFGSCSQFVTNVPQIAQVVQHRPYYSGKSVTVTGDVARLDRWTSSRLKMKEEVFQICEDGCIRVYMPAHSPIHNGERVTVRGTYYDALHAGRKTYHNEIEAAEVLPRE